MKRKRKGQEEVEQMIVRGHRAGVCDSYGNSIDINGIPKAKPRTLGCVKLHKIYPKDGPSIIVVDNRGGSPSGFLGKE